MSAVKTEKQQSIRIQDQSFPGNESIEMLLGLSGTSITIRELISERVRAECDKRLVAIDGRPHTALVVPESKETELNGDPENRHRKINQERQIEIALKAFDNNGFILLVDDVQAENPDEEIPFRKDMLVTFLRLTPLVGG